MHDDPWEHGHFGDEEEVVFGSIADDGFPINPDWLRLTSVGIDIGSSTSHLMFSRIHLQRAGELHSSRYVVVERETLYRSPILLTPYTADYAINTEREDLSANAPRSGAKGGFGLGYELHEYHWPLR